MKYFIFALIILSSCQQLVNYRIHMLTEASFGLEVGSRVQCMGIDIGSVVKIANFDHEMKKVSLSINNDFFIPDRSEFLIKPNNDFKIYVDIISVDSEDFLERGDIVEGRLSGNIDEWMEALQSSQSNEYILDSKIDSIAVILNNALLEINKLNIKERE